MLELLLLALLGCLLGVITGLTPGLHVNTIAIIGLCLFPSLPISPLEFAVVMVSMAITHSFLDFIPAIFLGVPEEETALSVLPTHQLLLQGKALEAVQLTAIGSLLGLGFSLILLLPALFVIPLAYQSLRPFIVYILLIAVILLIIREKEKRRIFLSTMVFFMSGWLGIIMFEQKLLSTTQVLFPVFVGLFGLSNILFSLKSETIKIPQDEFIRVKIDRKMVSSGILGSLGGVLVGILPAMSPSQVGVLMYEIFGTNIRSFIISISAINTSDAIYSFVALYTIKNPRSGVATIVGKVLEMDFNALLFMVGTMAFIALFATILHIKIGGWVMKFVEKVNYRLLSVASLLLVLTLVYLITGFFGILVTLLATSIGLLPIFAGISRTHCMGVLLVPTILYFFGF
ncbi:MAG: tripartite tricarboxylate transporter permease [Candidatus Altiarchaeales archaeon]|nr:tripartite tricarboxylate transporter permease [Candidatus Altiarchaeales archaeon]